MEETGWKGYAVMRGLRGYMPSDTAYCTTLGQARAIAKDWKDQERDDGATVTGNIRTHWEYDVRGGGVEYIQITDATMTSEEAAFMRKVGELSD
jgi:hypothetical protein